MHSHFVKENFYLKKKVVRMHADVYSDLLSKSAKIALTLNRIHATKL